MLLLHGGGANGKTVFQRVLRSLLGDYGTQADASTFMTSRNDGIPNDIARLAGVRYVAVTELQEGRRMAESLVKAVTGGDTMVARHLYKEYFEFTPEFKLWLSGNSKPVIHGTDYAIWRRIRLIPFGVTIPEEQRDPNLLTKLEAELSGILNWAVVGCQEWQEAGLCPPASVVVATQEYRQESDTVGQFIAERCVVGKDKQAASGELYSTYKSWCEDGGERHLSQRRFGTQLTEHGFASMRTDRFRIRCGIGLVAT